MCAKGYVVSCCANVVKNGGLEWQLLQTIASGGLPSLPKVKCGQETAI